MAKDSEIMKALIIAIAFLNFAFSLDAQNAEGWVLKKEQDGIRIYSRPSRLTKFVEIRVETDIIGNITQLASILLAVENYPQWAYSTKIASIIKKTGPNDLIYYSEINVPWPSTNRDFYAHCKMVTNTTNHSFKMTATGLKDYLPVKNNIVRVPLSIGTWEASAISNKLVHVVYTLDFDPGGSVPAWLLDLFCTKGPLETFANLKKKMELLNK
jgi:hypothetical protein